MKIVILDSATLGGDIDFGLFNRFGEVVIYKSLRDGDLNERISDGDVIIVNKIRLGADNLKYAKNLKLICVTATGYDNIDLNYCRAHSIGVCNVRGYSTDSVAQLTAAMALSLWMRIKSFDDYVKDGSYSRSGVENHLQPVFYELRNKTWGIVGLGAIGRRVAEIAQALGCLVIAYKRKPVSDYECVGLDELCRRADIISLHLPLSCDTRNLLCRERIRLIKRGAIVINVARGAVSDEAALCDAVLSGRLGGLGVDVYSEEPMREDSPLMSLSGMPNVILTPHMAWGAYEARIRCMEEIALNIDAYFNGIMRNRVDTI